MIKQREGGPVLDLCLRRPYIEDGKRKLGPGSIQQFPWYWKPGLVGKMLAPSELMRGYRKIVNYLKRNSVPTAAKGFLAGRCAAKEIAEGRLTIHGAAGIPINLSMLR